MLVVLVLTKHADLYMQIPSGDFWGAVCCLLTLGCSCVSAGGYPLRLCSCVDSAPESSGYLGMGLKTILEVRLLHLSQGALKALHYGVVG